VTLQDAKRLGSSWCKKNVIGFSVMDLMLKALDGHRDPYLGGIRTQWKKMKSGPFKGVSICACVALEGSIMKSTRCSVYQKRPSVCKKALNPGDKQCLEARLLFQEAVDRIKP
jgi:Fe-S-cluster containining protein